ncbi:MAG: hypothetical protein JSU81_00550 [Candidatus Coatesbacteria bacterium]|nr:MAG: hypothetical protein JSU81_00550 [Candidatus Coatesbacteria bacterium]
MRRDYLRLAAALAVLGACAKPAPRPETSAGVPYGEDEFAARAAALQKSCELAVVYLGTDDARARAVVGEARGEALEAVRRAPDAYRGAVFARASERLAAAEAALAGAGEYSPPLSEAAYERLRADLLLTAAELRPLGEPYYLKVARRYEGRGRRRQAWGPQPAPAKKPRERPARPAAPPAPEEAAPPAETPASGETPPPTPPETPSPGE